MAVQSLQALIGGLFGVGGSSSGSCGGGCGGGSGSGGGGVRVLSAARSTPEVGTDPEA